MPAYIYSVPATAPQGLDSKRYIVSTVIQRADRKPLTEADSALVERIYAKELASEGIEPTAKPKPSTRAKTKTASTPAARSAAKELRAPAKRKAG